MARTLADNGQARRETGGGVFAVLLVLAILVSAVWGAWMLGVMAGDRAEWRGSLPDLSRTLRSTPNPQPPPLPTQRRPAVKPELRD
ncbi:hypothetical protein [Caulobacter sp. 602-1]|uniref:hypothetical protein n=1 Tax=Caulobacter sp. 602-1 TaxID=2492472 RepID=UPI000F6445EC|nr:hypothetical protein [Caulobacter sp. 602-1]RRN65633.1 hypothetical protein EIK80_08800 [Caulobacter sp. 602-1]